MSRKNYYSYYFEGNEIEGSTERIRAKNELVYSYLQPHLPPGAAVLELGVGKGFFARLCRERGHAYRGVEASEEQCSRLRSRGLEVTAALVPPLPEELGNGYGLVYSAHLLEHLPSSREVHQLLEQCAAVISEDGVVAALFPDAAALGSEFWNCDYTHCYPTTERRVAQAMTDAGLEVIAAHHLHGHYTGAGRMLARVASRPLFLRGALAATRDRGRRDLLYRGWMYLQRDVLLVASPRR